MLTIFLQWEKCKFNLKTAGFCRLHDVVAVCSWIASSTCLASFRFLLRIRFFYEKKNWVWIRIDWTTTCSEVCSRCKACKRAGNQCNQCRARRTWTVTMQPLLSGGKESTRNRCKRYLVGVSANACRPTRRKKCTQHLTTGKDVNISKQAFGIYEMHLLVTVWVSPNA